MPRLPLLGYTEQELQAEYERGVIAGRREGREMLYTVLLGLKPAAVREFDSQHLPDFPELIERLGQVWRTEIGQGRLRQDELTKRVAELERELASFQDVDWPGRLDRLNQELKQTRAERDTARQALEAVQTELQFAKGDSAAKQRGLEYELDQADQLIVKYEAQHHQQ